MIEILKGWFKQVEKEVRLDEGTRQIKNKYIVKGYQRKNNQLKYFDEDERVTKNNIVTWNDNKGLPIFGEDKKRSQSKKI